MEIFERASRAKLMFPSTIGALTTDQLWDLPLTARASQPDLDKLARAVSGELKSLTEGSFVEIKPDPRKTMLTLQLDILKHIIQSKLDAKAAAEKATETAERKRKLLAALDTHKEKELLSMTPEQIEAEIAKLG